jgi:hypothetical protein
MRRRWKKKIKVEGDIFQGRVMDRNGSGTCPVTGFGFSVIDSPGF